MGTISVDQTTNHWLVSATGGSGSLPVVLWPAGQVVYVSSLVWQSSGAVAGNGVIVQNNPASGGNTVDVWEAYATGSDFESYPISFGGKLGLPVNGLQVSKLDTGILHIYIR